MGLIVDIVPNHVGVDDPEQNPWWWDVLSTAGTRAYASYFDIDWDAGRAAESCCRCWVPTTTSPTSTVDGDVLRLGDLALSRSRRAPDRAPAPEVHDRQHYRLVGWRNGVVRLPAVLLDHLAGRAAAGGPRGVRRHPRRGATLVRPRVWSTACASTTRTDCPTRPAISTWLRETVGPRRLDRDREDPGRRRSAGTDAAGRRHHRL